MYTPSMEEQILVQSDNHYEFVKFAASTMGHGHGHVLNLNKINGDTK